MVRGEGGVDVRDLLRTCHPRKRGSVLSREHSEGLANKGHWSNNVQPNFIKYNKSTYRKLVTCLYFLLTPMPLSFLGVHTETHSAELTTSCFTFPSTPTPSTPGTSNSLHCSFYNLIQISQRPALLFYKIHNFLIIL